MEMESEDINWTLCVICQTQTTDKTRSTNDGLISLSTSLEKFKVINALPRKMLKLFLVGSDLLTTLQTNTASYHHTCRNKHNDRMYHRVEAKFEQGNVEHAEGETSIPYFELRSRRESILMGELSCCFCAKHDTDTNLMAAGTYQALKEKVNTLHLKMLGEKWLKWALCLPEYSHVGKALSVSDLASNQLYYHKRCYTEFNNSYCKYNENNSVHSAGERDEKWFKSITLSKIASYLFDKESESPGTIYIAKELELMYITLFKFHDVNVNSHVSRFADSLVEAAPGLRNRTVNKKVTVFFESTIDMLLKDHIDIISEPNEFARSIKDVVIPIRNSMKMIHNKFDGTFAVECQKDSVPIQLLVLISMLVDGTGIDNQGFSQETMTISQLVMYNFRNKQVLGNTKRRHLKRLETPLPTYISLKIYATVRSRSLIDSLFSLGICLPYNRVLEITKDIIGRKELHKYELNGCSIPDNVKLNIYTVVAKDNIDLNSRSTIVKSHFHGISMSILQSPSPLNPGVSQEHNLEASDPFSFKSKKVPSLPLSYTELKPLPHYENLHFLLQLAISM